MGYRSVNPERFEFKWLKKPQVQGGLSSTVIVDGTYYVNISFSFALVQRAGRLLPEGCSVFRPAYLTMRFDIVTQHYKMYVQYVDSARGSGKAYELLKFTDRPKWLGFMRPLPGMAHTKRPRKQKEEHVKDHQAQPA